MLPALEEPFERIFRTSALYPGEHLTVDVIVNLQAGALSSRNRYQQTVMTLDRLTRGLVGPVRDRRVLDLRFHQTHYVGHARELTAALLAEEVPGRRLIVSAGGDGTHGEVLSAAATGVAHGAAEAVRGGGPSGEIESPGSDQAVHYVRLPLGTGNDGADAPDLASAVRLLLGSARFTHSGRLVVAPAGMTAFHGYNIASVGLDAYVAFLTNRLKRRFAGDLYRLLADVMTLFYERLVGVGPMRVELTDEQGRADELAGTFLLIAMGVTGYRRYGGGKLVLPAYENLCAIEPLGLAGKLRLKSLFYRGEHVHEPNVHMRSVRRLRIHYDRKAPLQIDGETVWLEEDNFPLEIQLLSPRIPVLAYEPREQRLPVAQPKS